MCAAQIQLSSYASVEDKTLTIRLTGDHPLAQFCATPYKGGAACAYELVGSSVPGAGDKMCSPTGHILAA